MAEYSEIYDLMMNYPDLWREYLQKLSSGENVIPFSSLGDYDLAYPKQEQDPWYTPVGYADPSKQMGLGLSSAPRNTQGDVTGLGGGITPMDLFRNMGVSDQAPGMYGSPNRASGPGVNYGEYVRNQEAKDLANPPGNYQGLNPVVGGGGNNVSDPTQQWDTLFDKDFLREIFGEAMGKARGLQPYQSTPFEFQPTTPNPMVDNTIRNIMERTKAYRGARY